MSEPIVLPTHILKSLLYLEALGDAGISPPTAALEVYATSNEPRPAIHQSALDQATKRLAMGIMGNVVEVAPAEPVAQYLNRVGWATIRNDHISLTTLGLGLLAGLRGDRRKAAQPTDEDIAVTMLDPADPFVYASATRRIAEAGSALLVDPWFKADSLSWLLNATTVSRLLVLSRNGPQAREIEALKLALYGLQSSDQGIKLEIRAAADGTLHDRCIVSPKEVLLLGTSMTGIGHHLSAIYPLPEAAARSYRDHVEAQWSSATAVEARPMRTATEC